MDLRERTNDYLESIKTAIDGLQMRMWTAMPGIVQSFDPDKMTCVVKVAVQGRVTALVPGNPPRTRTDFVDIPPLLDCPVCFPQGGGCTMTFPLAAGDECLVVFGSRGIDWWWQNGCAQSAQPPAEARMHDLSDGFVVPGPFSQPRRLSQQGNGARASNGVNGTGAELRSNDGSTSIHLDPAAQAVAITAPGGVAITGNVTVSGDVIASNVSLATHEHSLVQAGEEQSGPPVPA